MNSYFSFARSNPEYDDYEQSAEPSDAFDAALATDMDITQPGTFTSVCIVSSPTQSLLP